MNWILYLKVATIALGTVLFVWGFVGVVLPPRVLCWVFGHPWNRLRPRTVQHLRIEDCPRCFATRPHVVPIGMKLPVRATQFDFDGTAREYKVLPLTPSELELARAKRDERVKEAQTARDAFFSSVAADKQRARENATAAASTVTPIRRRRS